MVRIISETEIEPGEVTLVDSTLVVNGRPLRTRSCSSEPDDEDNNDVNVSSVSLNADSASSVVLANPAAGMGIIKGKQPQPLSLTSAPQVVLPQNTALNCGNNSNNNELSPANGNSKSDHHHDDHIGEDTSSVPAAEVSSPTLELLEESPPHSEEGQIVNPQPITNGQSTPSIDEVKRESVKGNCREATSEETPSSTLLPKPKTCDEESQTKTSTTDIQEEEVEVESREKMQSQIDKEVQSSPKPTSPEEVQSSPEPTSPEEMQSPAVTNINSIEKEAEDETAPEPKESEEEISDFPAASPAITAMQPRDNRRTPSSPPPVVVVIVENVDEPRESNPKTEPVVQPTQTEPKENDNQEEKPTKDIIILTQDESNPKESCSDVTKTESKPESDEQPHAVIITEEESPKSIPGESSSGKTSETTKPTPPAGVVLTPTAGAKELPKTVNSSKPKSHYHPQHHHQGGGGGPSSYHHHHHQQQHHPLPQHPNLQPFNWQQAAAAAASHLNSLLVPHLAHQQQQQQLAHQHQQQQHPAQHHPHHHHMNIPHPPPLPQQQHHQQPTHQHLSFQAPSQQQQQQQQGFNPNNRHQQQQQPVIPYWNELDINGWAAPPLIQEAGGQLALPPLPTAMIPLPLDPNFLPTVLSTYGGGVGGGGGGQGSTQSTSGYSTAGHSRSSSPMAPTINPSSGVGGGCGLLGDPGLLPLPVNPNFVFAAPSNELSLFPQPSAIGVNQFVVHFHINPGVSVSFNVGGNQQIVKGQLNTLFSFICLLACEIV
jgi:hypothetical protein